MTIAAIKDSPPTLEKLLQKAALEIDLLFKQEEERNLKEKSRFNVFTCLTRHHLEELHSKFLFYLLNPQSTHDCQSFFLEQFFQGLLKKPRLCQLLPNFNLKEVTTAKVRREVYIGATHDPEVYGFIDITIETRTVFIVIENKIRANEQPRQIERYVKYGEQVGKLCHGLFLTPRGHAAQEAGATDYTPISYEYDILEWLQRCIDLGDQPENVSTGLKYYIDLLKKSILAMPDTLTLNEVKAMLLKEENALIVKHLSLLRDSLVHVRNELRCRFFEQLGAKLAGKAIHYMPYPVSSLKEVWSKLYQGCSIGGENLVLTFKGGNQVHMEIQHDWESLYYGLLVYPKENVQKRISINPNGIAEVSEIMSEMQRKLHDLNAVDNVWFCWREFRVIPDKDIPFSSDELNHKFLCEMDSIVERCTTELTTYVTAWRQTCQVLQTRWSDTVPL